MVKDKAQREGELCSVDARGTKCSEDRTPDSGLDLNLNLGSYRELMNSPVFFCLFFVIAFYFCYCFLAVYLDKFFFCKVDDER